MKKFAFASTFVVLLTAGVASFASTQSAPSTTKTIAAQVLPDEPPPICPPINCGSGGH